MNSDTERRKRILAAAERVLHRYGPVKTTMMDIAQEAAVAVGSLYLEFASKDAILEALSHAGHEEVLARMRLEAGYARPVIERLRAVFDARVEGFRALASKSVHACSLLHCKKSPILEAGARFAQAERKLVVELLEQGVRAGEFSTGSCEERAEAVLAAYMRFEAPQLFELTRVEADTLLRGVHELVLFGLAKRTLPPKVKPGRTRAPRRQKAKRA